MAPLSLWLPAQVYRLQSWPSLLQTGAALSARSTFSAVEGHVQSPPALVLSREGIWSQNFFSEANLTQSSSCCSLAAPHRHLPVASAGFQSGWIKLQVLALQGREHGWQDLSRITVKRSSDCCTAEIISLEIIFPVQRF